MKFVQVFIFVVLCYSCHNAKVSEKQKKCQIDPIFLSNYISDINKVILFSTTDEQDFKQAYKSFLNLEILTNDSRNIDSLSNLFHKSSTVKENLQTYMRDWLAWLDSNQCYTLNLANQKFNRIKELYPPANYNDKDFIDKLRIKNSVLVESLNLSKEEIDAILIEKDKTAYDNSLPGWRVK